MDTTTATGQPSAQTVALARENVRDLLGQSAAFRALDPARREEIARQTVEVAAFLAEPHGGQVALAPVAGIAPTPATAQAAPADPYAMTLADGPRLKSSRSSSGGGGDGKFVAQAAREGAAAAGALLSAVNFPEFVSGLIKGVFHAIVQSSIEQMEAYGRLVSDVAKSLNQFRDDNVSVNQGRDHLVESFPDTFMIDVDTGGEGGAPQPRVRLRDGVDESAALKKVNSLPVEGGPVSSLDDETIEQRLVPAARTQLATSRQQLLATMVMMGINRVVVTDGRIAAKVMYDFKARDNFKRNHAATAMEYGDQYRTTSEGEYESESQHGGSSYKAGEWENRGGSYYASGAYKSTAEPVLTLVSATTETTDSSLETKASLAGSVDINFKSDYFPLEKMADSFQISQIQNAAQPGGATAGVPAAAPATTPAPAAGPAK